MRYFVLETTIGESNAEMDFYDMADATLSDAPRCPSCNRIIGMLTWQPPFRVEIEFWENEYGDLSFFSDYVLLSEKFVKHFNEEKLTGLDMLGQAEIIKVKPKRMIKGLPVYYIGKVRWSKAIFDDIASEADWEKPWTCETCRESDNILRIKRVIIKEDTWDGEDIFYARGLPGTIITSERFKEFVERNHLKNIKLIEASKYSFDFYPNEA